MLLYDWNKILKEGKRKPRECVRIFRMLASKSIPKNKYDPIYKYRGKDFSGESFLYREDLLWENSFKYSHRDICYYLALASQRSTGQFLATGTLTLDLIQANVDPRDYVSDSSLIHVDSNDKIHFLYETFTK